MVLATLHQMYNNDYYHFTLFMTAYIVDYEYYDIVCDCSIKVSLSLLTPRSRCAWIQLRH